MNQRIDRTQISESTLVNKNLVLFIPYFNAQFSIFFI